MPSLFRLPTAYQMKHTLLSMTFQALCYIILTLHSYYLTSAQIHVGNIVAAQEMFPPVPYLVFSYALNTLEESWEQTNGFDNNEVTHEQLQCQDATKTRKQEQRSVSMKIITTASRAQIFVLRRKGAFTV